MERRQPNPSANTLQPDLDVEEVLHTVQDLQSCIGDDLQAICSCLLDERRDSLVSGGAIVRLISRTNTRMSACPKPVSERKKLDHVRFCDLQQCSNDTLKVWRKRTGVLFIGRVVQFVQPIR